MTLTSTPRCGGLTEGLKRAGIDVCHGVESDGSAIAAWEVNNRGATMWNSDVHELLERIIANEPGLPRPGSVDVLAMGPPCNGFTETGPTPWQGGTGDKGASDREELRVALQFTQHMRPAWTRAVCHSPTPISFIWRILIATINVSDE